MQNNKLVYIYDTLCGWCYVASPAMKEIANYAFEHGIEFEFHHRRLFTDEYVPIMSDDFIRMIRRVGNETAPKMTGITFSDQYYDLVESAEFVHNSHLTAMGIAAAKQLAKSSEKAFAYGKQLQDLIFQEGQNPANMTTITNAAKGLFDAEMFAEELESERTARLVLEESDIALNYSRELGEQGIPFLYQYSGHSGNKVKLDPYRPHKTKETIARLNNISNQTL